MKKLKNILYICVICLITSVIGYFVYSYTQFNNGNSFTQETFRNGFYRTKNTKGFVSFGSFKNSVICVNDNYYFIDDVKYENGIFTLSNKTSDDVYLISVVDENIIYSSSFNTYFYNVHLWEN